MKKVLLLLALLSATACASPRSTDGTAEPRAVAPPGGTVPDVAPGVVDGATAHRLFDAGVRVVDVRTREEFAAGHIPGALNIPFDQIEARAAEIGPPSTPVLAYCQTGRRSAIAVRKLRDKGFTQLYDLQAYDRWVASEPPEGR